MIRVTSGTAKNKKLISPEIEGFRSVQEIAKLALFSIIGDKVKDAMCLDLFAGNGNLGIEALSRGAGWCDFVDNNRTSGEAIRQNLENCNFIERSALIEKDAVKHVTKTDKQYDLIFADPFYEDTAQVFLMKNIGNILKEGGILAFFHGSSLNFADLMKNTDLELVTTRKFGVSFMEILTKKTS